jgi:hypothetical protein
MMTESLAEVLFELLGERQKESLAKGWPAVPDWVFCSEVSTAPWDVKIAAWASR